jgi:putative heme degradation protein
MTPKRSPEELWRLLIEEAGESEVEAAANVGVAEAEKELAEAGFDVAAERAKAEALLRDLESKGRGRGSR